MSKKFVVTGKLSQWSRVLRQGHKPELLEDVRLWVRPEGEGRVKAHVFRSVETRLDPGQDTIWVRCMHPDCIGREYEWQASHEREWGIMEGDYLTIESAQPHFGRNLSSEEWHNWYAKQQMFACPHIRAFLAEIGYTKDFVAEDDAEGFLAFLNNLEAQVAEEDWEVEDE